MKDTSSKEKPFLQGVIYGIPLMIPTMLIGFGYGIMALQSGLTWLQSMAMSLIVYAGSAQFTAIGMFAIPPIAPLPIILTTFLINLRHLLYSTSLAPYYKEKSLSKQLLFAYIVTDESYAMNIGYFAKGGTNPTHTYGTSIGLYLSWATGSALGAALGGFIENPMTWGLDFLMPACFIGLLIPLLTSWKELVIALVSGILAIVTMGVLPGKWYIIIAAVAATVLGGGLDYIWPEPSI